MGADHREHEGGSGASPEALDPVLAALSNPDTLVKASATGRQRGQHPRWRRVEARYVDLKAGRRLQTVRYDATQAYTDNYGPDEAAQAVAALIAEPFGSWHVVSTDVELQARFTKKGRLLVHRRPLGAPGGAEDTPEPDRTHDRAKAYLVGSDSAVARELGLMDQHGKVKPTRSAKLRQVEEFVRHLKASLQAAKLPHDKPLHVVDLGCGNAYLTFAAWEFLTKSGYDVAMTGVDVKAQSLADNTEVAQALGANVRFVQSSVMDYQPDVAPHVVLALHACDTATDDALARAVEWESNVVLAAPCCHHDLSAQLRHTDSPLLDDGILRERFADTLTDALRASLLRAQGYRVEVTEFITSEHTPRNTLIRGVSSARDDQGARAAGAAAAADLTHTWGVRPKLAELLDR